MNISTKTLVLSSLALGAVALTSPALIAAQTASNSANLANCIATDVKGTLNYTGDHEATNPVTGHLENVGTDTNCPNTVYVHIFGTNNLTPHVGDWLTSQVHLGTETYTVPAGTNQNISVNLPTTDYCWYQVDATRTSTVDTTIYHGDNMIDYVLVKNRDCNITPTPTATPSATPTPTSTTTNNGGSGSSENKTVESIKAEIAPTKMAPTGGFLNNIMNIVFSAGMMVSALGAASYAKDRKTKLS